MRWVMRNPARIWENDVKGVYENRVPVSGYVTWRNMIARCYLPNKKWNVSGATVCNEWLKFSRFKKWFDENHKDGMELDKDIIGSGKIYSPENCVFVPKSINLLANTKGHSFARPWKNKWMSLAKINGKTLYVGTFSSRTDAVKASYAVYSFDAKKRIENEFAKGAISSSVMHALLSKIKAKSV